MDSELNSANRQLLSSATHKLRQASVSVPSRTLFVCLGNRVRKMMVASSSKAQLTMMIERCAMPHHSTGHSYRKPGS